MSFSRQFDLFNSFTNFTNPSFFFQSAPKTLEINLEENLRFALDILSPNPYHKPALFEIPTLHPFLPYSQPSDLAFHNEIQLQILRNRINALELGFDRKFKWTAEIKGGKGRDDRKYKVTAEIKGGGERRLKWMADVKGKGSYSFEAETISAVGSRKGVEKEKKKKKGGEGGNDGVVALRKVCV